MAKHKLLRIWAKMRGKDRVYQVTKQIAEAIPPRIGVDMDIISEEEALAIQKRSAEAKQQASIDRRQGEISKALAVAKQNQVKVEIEAKQRKEYESAVAAQGGTPEPAVVPEIAPLQEEPKTPEEVMADMDAESGSEDSGAIKEDDLDEKKRNELFDIIDKEVLDVKKAGKKAALVIAIRESRKLVAKAVADASAE